MNLNRVIILILSVAIFSGCKKVVHENLKAASNNSTGIMLFNDVFEQVNLAVSDSIPLDQFSENSWFLNGGVCANVSLDPTGSAFPKTLTIDYGTGCTGPYGVVRSGRIVATLSGNLTDEGSETEVVFDNYQAGQYRISGTHLITAQADAGNGPVLNERVTDATIMWNGQTFKWRCDMDRTWASGADTDYSDGGLSAMEDDVFELNGRGGGNDANTHPFSMEITEALQLGSDCAFIKGGKLEVTPENYNTGTVDYGRDTCDIQATMEVDGEVFNFTL